MSEKLTIDDLGYVEEMRKRLGRKEDDSSIDSHILSMEPLQRVGLIAGWYHGYDSWAKTYKGYFESQGLYLTTNPEADGVIFDN